MTRQLLVVAFTIITLAAGAATATTLKGKVVVSKDFIEALDAEQRKADDSSQSFFWKQPNGIIAVAPPSVDYRRDFGIVIEKEGADSPKAGDMKTVKVHFASLERRVIVTRPGSTIRFLNMATVDHELYAPDLPSFTPEKQTQNGFRPIQIKKDGIFQIRCRLVPSFSAYVVSSNAAYITKLSKDGTFEIDDLEEGKYKIRIFHGGKWVFEKKFAIKDAKTREKEIRLVVKPTQSK